MKLVRFRFVAAVVLLVMISLVGIAQEKRRLSLQRAISLQQYRLDQLLERQAHLRLRIHELTSPVIRPDDDEPDFNSPSARHLVTPVR